MYKEDVGIRVDILFLVERYKILLLSNNAALSRYLVVGPNNRTIVAQGLILGGSGRRAVVQTCLAAPKMPRPPSAFP